MSAPFKFADIGKSYKDLVGKDFPSDFELEANSTTANKLKFTVTGKQDVASGAIKSGELKAKYTDNKHNLTFTESYDLSSKVRLQTEVKGLGVAGSKLEADASVDLKSSTSPYGLAISASFAQEYVNWNSKFDLVKKEVNMDLVTGYQGLLVGGEVKLDVNNAAKAEYNLVAGYCAADYSVSFRANKNLKSYTLAFAHDVTSDLRVGAQGGWDGSNSSLGVGCQIRLDRDSMVKAKADHTGAIGLSYTQQIRPDVKVTVGTGFQSVTKDTAKPHVGLSFVFGK